MRNEFITELRDGLIKDRLCEEEPEVELNKMIELTMERESFVKTSFSSGTEVHRIGKVFNGNKRATGKGNKVFNKQWSFKEKTIQGNNQGSTGDGKTSKSTKKCFACGFSNNVFVNCKYKTYHCKLC